LIKIEAPASSFPMLIPLMNHEGAPMSTGEILFLILTIAAAGVFAATLAYYSRG